MTSSKLFLHLFTVDEANALLNELRPLMERIFRNLDLLRKNSEAVIREEQLTSESPQLMGRLQKNETIRRVIQEIENVGEKIQSYGCLCKGMQEGLVDFPCILAGRVVFLCWRYGEESVFHWHRIEDGFAGRRPLLDSDDDEEDGKISYH
ncbi:MAG: DUF2203 domain-containing protein [Candidatus Binatia bacterium]